MEEHEELTESEPSCKGLCRKLHLTGEVSWAERCPTCDAWIVFRSDGICCCCGTSWQHFPKLKGVEFDFNSEDVIDSQVQAFEKRAVMKVLLSLWKFKKPMSTLQLSVKAFNSANGCQYIDFAEDLNLLHRYIIAKGTRRYKVNVLTRAGEEAVQMYRVLKILNPDFEWDSYRRYKAKKHRMMRGKIGRLRGETYYEDEEDFDYRDQYLAKDYPEASTEWQDGMSLPQIEYYFTEERAIALLEM